MAPSTPKRSASKLGGSNGTFRPLVIIMVVGITVGSMLHQREGQEMLKVLGSSTTGDADSLQPRHLEEEEEETLNHTNSHLESLQKELHELKALKTASEQDFASLRAELSQLVEAQKEQQQAEEELKASEEAAAARLAASLSRDDERKTTTNSLFEIEEIEMGFGDSNNSTASKYAPTPLLRMPLKLELGQKQWREDIGYTSPACTLQVDDGTVFNRIVFLHMRKAGGSSVRNYLKNVASKHKIPLKIMEGWKLVEKPGDDPNTLYVTHMREPVSRAISHYKYEVRWDCKKQHWNPDFTPSLDNQQMNLTQFALKDWRAGPNKYWICSSECYTRWSTGLFHNPRTDPQMKPAGTTTLGSYHLMIVSEWLKDPDYARSLESIFGEKYIGRKRGMTCGEEAAKANKAVPLEISDETYDLMGARNQIDIGIYRNLTTCPYGPQFWGRHISFAPLEEGGKLQLGDVVHHK